MEFKAESTPLATWEGDAVVLGVFKNEWTGADFLSVDTAMQGGLKSLIESGDVALETCKTSLLPRPSGLSCDRLLIVGLGERERWDSNQAFCTASAAAKTLGAHPRNRLVFAGWPTEADSQLNAMIGSQIGSTGQDLFLTEKKLHPPKSIAWFEGDQERANRARVVASSIQLTRKLVNLPSNYIYPESFVEEVLPIASDAGLEVEVWDPARLELEKCGAMLGVARGSAKSPRLLILKHKGSGTGDFDTALVGKGVTFDSGGLSLKPSESMIAMKCDMAGGATVAGIMVGLGLLDAPKPVVGLIGLVENMISDDCYRLGDVLTSRSGKTIEIHNTDAEGRLVLADVLDVAADLQPKRMIDFATLTGACVVALGTDIVGAMSNTSELQDRILASAEQHGEWVWPLPMHSFFAEQIRGKVADIKNVGEGRWGGAITAGKFLEEFVRDIPWVHLDIAGPAFMDSPKAWLDAGATGVMVRSMLAMLSDE